MESKEPPPTPEPAQASASPSLLGGLIGQHKPFASREQEVFLLLARLSSELAAEHAELFREAGLTAAQYNVLRILRGSGEEALACGEIGERMVTRDSDVTRLLDRLEKQGLVRRARDERDRRVVKTRITERGSALLADLDAPTAELHRRQFAHLDPNELRRLATLLERALAAR